MTPWRRSSPPTARRRQCSISAAPVCASPPGEFAPTGDIFTDVNTLALQNLTAWVPALFGEAAVARSSAEQGYRVSSEALGRDLQEDLSLHPNGCKDFGLHDQNDERCGKRSPIDVVMQWSERYGARLEDGETPTTALQAARWLAARLGIDAGAPPKSKSKAKSRAESPEHPPRQPKPSVGSLVFHQGRRQARYRLGGA